MILSAYLGRSLKTSKGSQCMGFELVASPFDECNTCECEGDCATRVCTDHDCKKGKIYRYLPGF